MQSDDEAIKQEVINTQNRVRLARLNLSTRAEEERTFYAQLAESFRQCDTALRTKVATDMESFITDVSDKILNQVPKLVHAERTIVQMEEDHQREIYNASGIIE